MPRQLRIRLHKFSDGNDYVLQNAQCSATECKHISCDYNQLIKELEYKKFLSNLYKNSYKNELIIHNNTRNVEGMSIKTSTADSFRTHTQIASSASSERASSTQRNSNQEQYRITNNTTRKQQKYHTEDRIVVFKLAYLNA